MLSCLLSYRYRTNFRLFQTERVCRRQFQIWWKWQKVIQTGRKHCVECRNCSLRAISPFPTVFSKGLFPTGVKMCYCVGMSFNATLTVCRPFYPYFGNWLYLSNIAADGSKVTTDRTAFHGLEALSFPVEHLTKRHTQFGPFEIESKSRRQNRCNFKIVCFLKGMWWVENIVGKGENAGYQHFLLFPLCFQKPSFTCGFGKIRNCVVKT